MAVEHGAHLVSPALNSPSIFEVLAQENLHTALRPAFEYLLKILVNKYPQHTAYLKYYSEIYLAFDLIIQNHFLKYYGKDVPNIRQAFGIMPKDRQSVFSRILKFNRDLVFSQKTLGSSFSENFYGLKRIPTETDENSLKTHHKLPNKVHRKSLIFLVLFPYIKLLITKKFELERELEADGIRHENAKLQKLRRIFLVIYPWIHFVMETTILLYQLAFTFGRIRVHSPFIYLSGSRLTILSQEDVVIASQSFVFPSFGSLREFVSGVLNVMIHNVAVGVTWSLSVGAFFIQFVEWWNATKQSSGGGFSQYVPPAPKLTQLTAKIDPHLCPLCLKKRTNDTALSTSGFVFCYRCIHQHLQLHGACPITKYVTTTDNLIRLYPPNT
uniref:Peroxisome assembly protein 12 n=1 Tax=Strigamia maritima TaxID=126957 RepID=T1JC72_STRMM